MSRSQIDLPSTSRQTQELRISSQEVYYHYAQGRPRYGVPQVYMKSESNQDVEFQRRNSAKGIEKAASQPQLSYEEERAISEASRNPVVDGLKNHTMDPLDKEKYEITVEDRGQNEFGRNGSQRKEDYRPETSFGIHRDEMIRSSTRDHEHSGVNIIQQESQDSPENISVQKRIEELQRRTEHDNNHSIVGKISKESDMEATRIGASSKTLGLDVSKRLEASSSYSGKDSATKSDSRKDELEQGIARLKIQNQGSGSDYDKAGQSSSNVDSGRGSAVYSSGRRPPPEDRNLTQGSYFVFHSHPIFLLGDLKKKIYIYIIIGYIYSIDTL